MSNCTNCKREDSLIELTKHHMIPKSKHGKSKDSNYIILCKDCHSQLHKFYTEKFLAKNLNTIELILTDEKFQKFGIFTSKQTSRIQKKTNNNKIYN